MVAEAYATFDHPDVCPLVELEPGLYVVELFHGPTLAFKDVALQLVGRLFDHELSRRGERATIVVATSGDTGSAAIAACVGRPTLDIVVLHPAGRVSDVQRRQMTTVDAPNVHNVAVEGTFDDCQDLVKALFADAALRDRVGLSAMNSINWARVAAQIVYYVAAAAAGGPCDVAVPDRQLRQRPRRLDRPAGRGPDRAPGHRLQPQRHPHPVGRHRRRWRRLGVVPDAQPQHGHPGVVQPRAPAVRAARPRRGGHRRADGPLPGRRARSRRPRDPTFVAASLDDAATLAVIADLYHRTGYLADPHTAVGIGAARRCRAGDPDAAERPVVCMATAHPAKFPDAVEQATGVRPALPDHLADLFDRPERYDVLPPTSPPSAPTSNAASGRRSGAIGAITCGGRTPLPREISSASHSLARPGPAAAIRRARPGGSRRRDGGRRCGRGWR